MPLPASEQSPHGVSDGQSHRALQPTRRPSKDPTSTNVRQISNTLVSYEKENFFELDIHAQREVIRYRLIHKKKSRYHTLDDKAKERYIKKHINQIIQMNHSQTSHLPPAILAPQVVLTLPSTPAPVSTPVSAPVSAAVSARFASAHGPSVPLCQATTRSKSLGFPRPSSLQATYEASQLQASRLRASWLALGKARPLDSRVLQNVHLPEIGKISNLEAYTTGDPVQLPCTKCTTGNGRDEDDDTYEETYSGSGNSGGTVALTIVQEQLLEMQKQQGNILTMVGHLRKEHNDLYSQAVANHKLHDSHQLSIDVILTFIDRVYNRSLDGQGEPDIA
ncbi:hypothetical protein VE00_09475 [Pseudogymnoascus sp. WSF 3629]|nr:hypothetical protein VE00_09475 [Pseudogymnoascus sp. WSF 3629]